VRGAAADAPRPGRSGMDGGPDGARRSPSPEAAERLRPLEEMAAQRRERLDRLPDDPGGRIRGLQDYPFMEVEAWQKFQELMLRLRQEVMQSQVGGLMQAMRGMGPGEAETLRQMLGDLNRMLRERAGGGQPDFPGFMAEWGALSPGVGSLDELLDQP